MIGKRWLYRVIYPALCPLVLCASAPCLAFSGNDLMRFSPESRRDIFIGYFAGYVDGATAMIPSPGMPMWEQVAEITRREELRLTGTGHPNELCVPASVTFGQAAAVQEAWIAARPSRWDAPANVLMRTALLEAWRCKALP